MLLTAKEDLKDVRLEWGITVRGFAKIVGINYSHYSLIENQKSKTRFNTALKISQFYGSTVRDLFIFEEQEGSNCNEGIV
jgi:DNA-binding XRE family transcriptional regulator